jgi:hypothetical protein
VYEFKDNIKKLGFKWQPKLKLWYITLNKFTYEVYTETMKPRFINNTSSGTKYYYYVYYCTQEDIDNRNLNNAVVEEKQDLATKVGNRMAELGRREQEKANKEKVIKN